MAIILDLHWTENGHQNPMANEQSLQFWHEVARDYKNFGTVLFELFNEPYGISQDTWLKGDNNYVGYQQLYDAVRAEGANNIVIINGLDYAYDLSFVNDNFKITGFNIVYGSHPYNDKGYGTGPDFDSNFQGIIHSAPLIFTEFGADQMRYFDTDNRYQTVYQRILDYTNENHISYTGWAWWVEPNNPAFPALISDWAGTPLNGGQQIFDDIARQPGDALDRCEMSDRPK